MFLWAKVFDLQHDEVWEIRSGSCDELANPSRHEVFKYLEGVKATRWLCGQYRSKGMLCIPVQNKLLQSRICKNVRRNVGRSNEANKFREVNRCKRFDRTVGIAASPNNKNDS
jgi:hypothetical protein